MDYPEGDEDEARSRRRQLGKRLGLVGIALLFSSAISIRFVPAGWILPLLALLAAGAGIIVTSYYLVR